MNNLQLVTATMDVLGTRRWDGLEGLVDQFVHRGLGEVINSWISTEENLPISAAEVRQVLGNERIARIATRAGISKREASLQLAMILPQLVDKLTPRGRIPLGYSLPKGVDLMRD